MARVPARDGEPPRDVVASDIAAESEPPHVVVGPKSEHVPDAQLEIEARGPMPARLATFEPRRLEVRASSRLEKVGENAHFGTHARRDYRLLPRAIHRL